MQHLLQLPLLLLHAAPTKVVKKNDAARAWIKEAGRMNHLKHSVP